MLESVILVLIIIIIIMIIIIIIISYLLISDNIKAIQMGVIHWWFFNNLNLNLYIISEIINDVNNGAD